MLRFRGLIGISGGREPLLAMLPGVVLRPKSQIDSVARNDSCLFLGTALGLERLQHCSNAQQLGGLEKWCC